LRKILGKIHTWLGLLCAPYLIIFGFSSLHFNHHFGFVESGRYDVDWEQQVSVADTSDDGALAVRVRDEMGLPGWVPWWLYDRQEDNTFAFNVNRPAKQYRVTVDPARTNASVVETRQGPFRVLNTLHALENVPGLGFTAWWKYYTYLSVLFVMYAGFSGIYFWSKRRDKTVVDWILFAGICGGSLLFMVFVRVWG
jgi:hypothetical protein